MADTPATEHVDYPHYPGELYNCPACAAECFCQQGAELDPMGPPCVHCAIRQEEMGHS